MNHQANFDAGAVVIQPIANGLIKTLNDQDGLYTLYMNGIKNGEVLSERKVVDCIQRGINPYEDYEGYLKLAENKNLAFIFSNTTEAGIKLDASDLKIDRPPNSFPAKLLLLLKHRYEKFNGDSNKVLHIIPCELIEKNGDRLKEILVEISNNWGLEDDFKLWLKKLR